MAVFKIARGRRGEGGDDYHSASDKSGGRHVLALGKNLVFSVFVLYLCHIVFFSILGMGWAFGGGSDATITPGVRLASKFRSFKLGASAIHLRAGESVRASYSARIERGAMVMTLRPYPWLSKLGSPWGHSDPIAQSGEGITDVKAPADGWYYVSVSSRNTLTSDEIKARPLFGPRVNATFRYRLSWQVIGG